MGGVADRLQVGPMVPPPGVTLCDLLPLRWHYVRLLRLSQSLWRLPCWLVGNPHGKEPWAASS